MRNLKISLCYHPTTIIFIDDNEDYLKQIQKHFEKILPCKTFSNPLAALDYLNNQYQQETFAKRCMTLPKGKEQDHDYFLGNEVEVRAIQQEMMRPDRFKEIALVVVDYAMPEMNGIKFCQLISCPNVLKLLLTGNADFDVAVEAFNKKIIDKFIKKGISDTHALLSGIRSLQLQHFINLSNILMNQAKSNILTSLENPYVADLFHKICLDHQIEEYFLMSDIGDFLLLDKEGHLSRFTVIDDQEINDLYHDAVEDGSFSEAALLSLKNREMIPLFETVEDIDNTPPEEWEHCYCPIQKVPGADEYYFAYKKELSPQAIERFKNVISLQTYLARVSI